LRINLKLSVLKIWVKISFWDCSVLLLLSLHSKFSSDRGLLINFSKVLSEECYFHVREYHSLVLNTPPHATRQNSSILKSTRFNFGKELLGTLRLDLKTLPESQVSFEKKAWCFHLDSHCVQRFLLVGNVHLLQSRCFFDRFKVISQQILVA